MVTYVSSTCTCMPGPIAKFDKPELVTRLLSLSPEFWAAAGAKGAGFANTPLARKHH